MFSVVIPLYNKEESIRKTILSILSQTFSNFEVIVVNDGSTDNSLRVLQSIEDPRIRIIDKANGGVSSARNRGILEAKYDWIAFLDGDDLWEKNKLQTCYDELSRFPYVNWIITGFATSRNSSLSENIYKKNTGLISNIFDSLNNGLMIHTSAVLVRKKLFEEHKGLYFALGINNSEDREVWYKISCIDKSPLYIAESLSLYIVDTQNENSLTRNKKEISKMHFLSMKERIRDFATLLNESDRLKLYSYVNQFNKKAVLNLWLHNQASDNLIHQVGLNISLMNALTFLPKTVKKMIIKLWY